MSGPDRSAPAGEVAEFSERAAALRQAASLPRADPRTLLDAALADLDGAIAALAEANGAAAGSGGDGRALSSLHSERRLLHAVFTAVPLPLYVVDGEGTVLRANSAACEVLGVGPGYATGKPLMALVEPAARAALRSQLAAVGRTGKPARLTCGMAGATGVVRSELVIGPVRMRGDAGRLLVALSPEAHQDAPPAGIARATETGDASAAAEAAVVATAASRLDLLAAAARLLLEGASISESVLLQRCARLLSASVSTWVIVDLRRRGQLRRHYIAGPDDPESTALAHAMATSDPAPGSVPEQVQESGQMLLLTHVADELALGASEHGPPFLTLLGATSLVGVPITDGARRYGVLTMVRRAGDGQFGLADAALAEEVGALLGLAISGRRMLRRRTEAADALRASLLPPVLKPVPGVEIASAHLSPTRGREVGGDFYDAYPTPGGWGVAIGDVCGKGEDAAAATAAARHAIRVLAHWNGDPADVLCRANDIMLAEEFGGRFVTASAAHLSWQQDSLRVVLATAGHPAPILVKPDGSVQVLPGGGVPLGIFPDPEPATLKLDLSAGDVLFFFTDGLTDARSHQSTYFEDSLGDCLAQLPGRPAADIVADVRTAVLDFCDGVLVDDLTMLVLRIGGPPPADAQ
ncbi:MAG TPA: SpoIIE family protein phosphatase [Streptosporangiaceae bacterium]|jgi:serine phosphatase RsbU (regulator of sigma subunit)/PAS domain-containing protein|nr:SpoIIE family protein phosphatase [Streptosporangiaceae bacterium]